MNLKFIYRLIFILTYLGVAIPMHAQSNWVETEGGATNDEALDIASDNSGNYYVTGYFTYSAQFGGTPLQSSGFSDIFIAKYNSSGNLIWVKKAGGNGPDRGNSISVDLNGNIYLTGYYNESATFETTTITSNNNSQDVFIAKYDTNGNLIWVHSVGGEFGDTGYGIVSDNLGNVIVTGQYKGQGIFGSTILNSMIDPNFNQPSYDLFVLKYDPSGNLLWVQDAKAKYDDRGMSVAIDDANNIFVVGQYSDTITVDLTYNNYTMNAGFLFKLDPAGNEQYFKSFSAAQTLLNAVVIDNNNEIYITGDFRGTLAISGPPTTYVSGAYTNKIVIAKFTNSGSVIWAEADASENEVTAKSVCLDNNNDAYIVGLFKCRFTEYSNEYGNAIFYSVGYRDIFITKYSTTGQRILPQHYGGPKDDYCSGITTTQIDNPAIAGSFDRKFNLPYTPAYGSLQLFTGNYNLNYCNDANYSSFLNLTSAGQKDMFIAKPFVANREPFDYYIRDITNNCFRDTIQPCINGCLDTMQSCSTIYLGTNNYTIQDSIFGPYYTYLWNTNSTQDTTLAHTSGIYTVEIKREDACWSFIDSIVIIIHPSPGPPLITDNWGVNINHLPNAITLISCAPDTVIITASINSSIADTSFWNGGVFNMINDTTIEVFQSGQYSFVNETDFGCLNINNISVTLQTVSSNEPTSLSIHYDDSLAEATDTLIICDGEQVNINCLDSIFGFMSDVDVFWSYTTPIGSIFTPFTNIGSSWVLQPMYNGLYTIRIDSIARDCDTLSVIQSIRNLFVIIKPLPNINVNLTGPTFACPYDTVVVYSNSDAPTFNWTASNIIYSDHDSIIFILGEVPQLIAYFASVLDSVSGCSNGGQYTVVINPIPPPEVTMNPPDGIVCPGDSLLLTADPGMNYIWVGPQGSGIGTNQSIWVDLPGFYHCIHTGLYGCVQTTNFVEAKEYNTPFLDVYPSNFICANGNTTISVIASNNALIEWQAPLSGNSTTQVVSSAGTYICHITLCGITTIDSIVVTQSNTLASITAPDTVLCAGDSLTLFANGGMQEYLWNPGNSQDPIYYITHPGTYTVTTMDAFGCYATSEPVTIYPLPQAIAPSFNDTIICAGQSIVLNANASNSILWYSSSTSPTPFHIGNNFTTPIINNNTSYFLQTADSVCASVKLEFEINVYTSSLLPSISGDTTICAGQILFLTTPSIPNGNYNWNGPNGVFSDTSFLSIVAMDNSYSGIYTLSISDTNCISPTEVINVIVTPNPSPYIFPDGTIYLCPGNTITLADTSGYANYIWWPSGQLGSSQVIDTAGIYFVTAYENGCSGSSNPVTVTLNNPANNPTATDQTICPNTSVLLTASGTGSLTWYNDQLQIVGTGPNYTTPLLDTTTTYYVQSSSIDGCLSEMVPVVVFVVPLNLIPPIYFNQPICVGQTLMLSTVSVTGATYLWTGPNGFSSTQQNPVINNVTLLETGNYQLQIQLNACSSQISTTLVIVNENPPIPTITGNAVYCEGDNISLNTNLQGAYSYSWQTAGGQSFYDSLQINFIAQLWENGITTLQITDSLGCSSQDTFSLVINPIPFGQIFTEPEICSDSSIYIYVNNNFNAQFEVTGPQSYFSNQVNDTILNAQITNSGYYSVEFTLNGCVFSDSIFTNVYPYPIIDLGIDTGICNTGGAVLFELNPNYSYLWPDGNSTANYLATDTGWLFVTAFVGPGCFSSDSTYIALLNCNTVAVNVISPNGDGINDYFIILNEGAKSMQVKIYNRWGNEIISWNELEYQWHGIDYNNNPVPEGVYYYIVDFLNYYDEHEILTGFITVFR